MDHSLDKKVKRNDNKLCQKGKLNYKNVFRSHLKVTTDSADLIGPTYLSYMTAFHLITVSFPRPWERHLINFHEIHFCYLSAALVQFFYVLFVLILSHFLFVFISQ